MYYRRSAEEARRDLSAWIAKWAARYQKLVAWVEETIEETLTFYRLPRQHHKYFKSTNLLERLNEEIRRRTYVVRIFPNSDACRHLIRALAVETHENLLESTDISTLTIPRMHRPVLLSRLNQPDLTVWKTCLQNRSRLEPAYIVPIARAGVHRTQPYWTEAASAISSYRSRRISMKKD